jgi:hypothetical protein
VQEQTLQLSEKVVFCIAVDRNGYVPCTTRRSASRSAPATPCGTPPTAAGGASSTTAPGWPAARNTKPFLLQTYRRDMGGGNFMVHQGMRGAHRRAAAATGAACGWPTGSDQPPRIGLVLGGGGARGAAHIGVLEVLERLRVPVHCVAGTSMGALVAGAWAAGVSPERMRGELTVVDWGDLFSRQTPSTAS